MSSCFECINLITDTPDVLHCHCRVKNRTNHIGDFILGHGTCDCYQPKEDKQVSKDCKHMRKDKICELTAPSIRCFYLGKYNPQERCESYESEEVVTEELKKLRQHAIDEGMELKTEKEIQWGIEENRGGKKFDQGKPDITLVPVCWVEGLIDVLMGGKEKYGRDNWQLGIAFSRLYSAADRHERSFWKREGSDKESGLHPLLHAAVNNLMLYWMDINKPEFDDRPGGK